MYNELLLDLLVSLKRRSSLKYLWFHKIWFRKIGLSEILSLKLWFAEAATGGVLLKNVFSKILQNSEENTCVGVSF